MSLEADSSPETPDKSLSEFWLIDLWENKMGIAFNF